MSPVTEVNATDRAVELADELDVDLSTVEGTGTGGRIGADDVRAAASSSSAAAGVDFDVHRCPPLVSGSAGPEVRELAALLNAAGHEVELGPFSVLDAGVLAAVKAFRAAQGIEPDPEHVPDGNETSAANTVTAADWIALYGAVEGS